MASDRLIATSAANPEVEIEGETTRVLVGQLGKAARLVRL